MEGPPLGHIPEKGKVQGNPPPPPLLHIIPKTQIKVGKEMLKVRNKDKVKK